MGFFKWFTPKAKMKKMASTYISRNYICVLWNFNINLS